VPRHGSAQTRPAQGIGTSSMRQTQRKPLTLTKWLGVGDWSAPDHDKYRPRQSWRLVLTPPFNRRINAQHHWSVGSERGNEQPQQNAAGSQTRPGGSGEHAMVCLVSLVSPALAQTHRTERRADHASTWGQNGPDDQQRDMGHGATRGGRIAAQNGSGVRQCRQVGAARITSLGVEAIRVYPTGLFLCVWIKSS
jgi:hypothetical protein